MADPSTKVSAASTSIAHIGSGASIAAGGFSGSADVSTALSFSGNLNRAPRCDVTLMVAPTATTSSTSMNIPLYRRDINIGSGASNKDGIPGASLKNKFMGNFFVSGTASGTSYYTLVDVPLPGASDCEFYIEDALSGNVPAGWTLTVLPKTDVGATA